MDIQNAAKLTSFQTLEEAEIELDRLGRSSDGNSCWMTLSDSMQVDLTPVQSVRLRPAMYIGGTNSSGCRALLMEVVSNAIDQYLQGFAKTVKVRAESLCFEVIDDGSGLAREKARKHLCNLHFSATADHHAPHIHLALRGVGICVVNALAEKLVIESFDDVGGWRQTYTRGELVSEEVVTNPGSTSVGVSLDRRIFRDAQLPMPETRRILFDAVHLFPGLRLVFNEETFFSQGGLLDLAGFEAAHRGVEFSNVEWENREIRFGYVHDGSELSLTCALVGTSVSKEAAVSSWVNGVLTPEHGTHIDGLRDALKGVGWSPAVIMIHVVMKEPEYAGPTRGRLGTLKVRGIVRDALLQPLTNFLADLTGR